MDKWPKGKQYAAPDFANVTDAFAGLYSMKVAALEKAVLFDEFAGAFGAKCKWESFMSGIVSAFGAPQGEVWSLLDVTRFPESTISNLMGGGGG